MKPLRHLYAIAAILLAGLYAPHWTIPTLFLVVYAVDLIGPWLFPRLRRTEESTEAESTLLERPATPGTTPETPAELAETNPESVPIHDAYALQAALTLPPDAKITVEDDTDNPWNRALQQIRNAELEDDATVAYADAFDPETALDDDTGDEPTPHQSTPDELIVATKEDDQ